MISKTRLYLIAPFLILLGVFLVDKIFLLPDIHKWVVLWKKVEPPLYESKVSLFEQLKEHYPEYKKKTGGIGVILGTSRSAEFSSDIIEKLGGPVTYNFSAPLAPPSFYSYWLEKLISSEDPEMDLKLAIVEADPLIFTSRSIDYSLSYSYDPAYVWENIDLFRSSPKNPWDYDDSGFAFDESETYFLKRLFSLYRYPVDFKTFRENGKDLYLPHPQLGMLIMKNMEFRDYMTKQIDQVNRIKFGGIPNLLNFQVSLVNLDEDARNTFTNMGLVHFRPSLTQVSFFKRIMNITAANNTPTIIYWPVVSEPLRRLMNEDKAVAEFKEQMVEYIAKHKETNPEQCIIFADYNTSPELKCRNFVDSFHLSGKCFEDLTHLLLRDLKECKNKQETAAGRFQVL